MQARYKAAMVLSGVGDAIGYANGHWEFEYNGEVIHKELQSKYGDISKLNVKLPEWLVSDDTVLHLATAEALMTDKPVGEELFLEIAAQYIRGARDMSGRAPGMTTLSVISTLEKTRGFIVPFNKRGGGCGAAMRTMCVGLRYPKKKQLQDLIAVAVEAGRMTHNCPTGFLGSVASALFTSFAVQEIPVKSWGFKLIETLPKVMEYLKAVGRDVEQNRSEWDYFSNAWARYLRLRNIADGKSEPVFPTEYGSRERDDFYKSVSFDGWGGASGHDAPMIAYDALLAAGDSWEKFCDHCVLHGGDNDSTGAIGCAWWGALYGMDGVPDCNYKSLEYRDRMEKAGEKLYQLSHQTKSTLKSLLKGSSLKS